MTRDERRRWNANYNRDPDHSPTDPSPLLETVATECRPGRALDVATGGGRNAGLLASMGWTVDAIDISRRILTDARERGGPSTPAGEINWILADVDSYGFPSRAYDLVTICNFDGRGRLSDIIESLQPGGLLVYEHYVEPDDGNGSPGNRYRFAPGELLALTHDEPLEVRTYFEFERGDEQRVAFVGQRSPEIDHGGLLFLPSPFA